MGVFDSSNEEFWCTDYKAKNLSSQRKKIVIFEKWSFWAIFLDFYQNGTLQGAGVFWVVISASKRFIWAIKHPHTMIFIFRLIMGFCDFSDPW